MKRLISSLLLSFTLLVGLASEKADSIIAYRQATGEAAGFYEIPKDLVALYYGRILPNLDDSRRKTLSDLLAGIPRSSSQRDVLGYAAEADTATINRILADPAVVKALSPDVRLLWGYAPQRFGNVEMTPLYAVALADGRPAMSGHIINNVSVEYDHHFKSDYLLFDMTPEATVRFAALTEKNIGRPLAFAINDKIFTTATVQNIITDGRVRLSGNQTRQQLITLLNSL